MMRCLRQVIDKNCIYRVTYTRVECSKVSLSVGTELPCRLLSRSLRVLNRWVSNPGGLYAY